jgi:hypothetical protein
VRSELESKMGNKPTRKLKTGPKPPLNDNKRSPTRQKKKRKFRLNLGPLRLYIEEEFEDLVQDEADGEITPRRRHMLFLKAVPLGLIAWVTDLVSIFVHLSR